MFIRRSSGSPVCSLPIRCPTFGRKKPVWPSLAQLCIFGSLPKQARQSKLAERIAAKKVLVVVGTGVSLASTGGDKLASWKGHLCRIANKRPCLLLNGMRVGATRQEADAREALAAYECDVAPVVFHDRPLYITASITTKTAQETDPASDAAAEIEALFLWIAGQVELSTTQQRDKMAIA